MKLLVYYLLVIFLETCYGEVTYVDPKDPENDCGFDNGGPIMQQVTKSLVAPVNLYWSMDYEDLLFVDEKVSKVFLYEPETGSLTTIEIHELVNESIKLLIPVIEDLNVYWLFTGDNRYRFEIMYDDEYQVSHYTLTERVHTVEDKDLIFNQGRTDFNGRLFFGTEPVDSSSNRKDSDLLMMETNQSAVVVNSEGMSSQIAFNKHYKKMLIVNEYTQQISLADYNLKEGTINKTSVEAVFQVSDWEIKGSMVDAVFDDDKGHIWIAFSGSGLIIKYDCEHKTPVYNFTMAEQSLSSIVWGGKYLDVLYVATTAPEVTTDAAKHPAAGAIFAVSGLNAKGVRSNDIYTTAL